jgi:putative ABC transport system permease protein
VVFGGSNWATTYEGVTPEYFDVRGWATSSGRPFDAADVATATKVVLLGETVAHNLFGTSNPLGQIVRVNKVPMVVIGVLVRKGQSLQAQDQDDTLLMPITTLRKRIIGGGRAKLRLVNSISVKVREHAATADTQAAIQMLLRERHRLQPDQGDDFNMRDLTEVLTAREESARAMTLLLAAVGAVSLLVGGISIMNMMLASVTERTREIGLRMAVGARRRDILYQFLIESLMIALLGAACGIALGIGASFAIADFAEWRTDIQPGAIALAIGFAAAVGVFFGFYPAHKASQLSPLGALRFE